MSNSEYNLDELVQSASFQAWATGKAGEQQKRYWDQWIRESEAHRKLALKAQSKITGFSFKHTAVSDTATEWKKINDRIEKRSLKRSRSYTRKTRGKWIYAAAASLLLIIMVGIAYWISFYNMASGPQNQTMQKVVTRYGQQKQIQLSDGSSIVLNAHSTLRYASGQSIEQGVRIFLAGKLILM